MGLGGGGAEGRQQQSCGCGWYGEGESGGVSHLVVQCLTLVMGWRRGVQAKTTKKITLRLECKECKTKKQLVIKRTKHFELGEKKKSTGHVY